VDNDAALEPFSGAFADSSASGARFSVVRILQLKLVPD